MEPLSPLEILAMVEVRRSLRLKMMAGRGGLGLSFIKTIASCLLNGLNLAPLNFYPRYALTIYVVDA
jgi:hypothetical protein